MSVADRLREILKPSQAAVASRVAGPRQDIENVLGGRWEGDSPSRTFVIDRSFDRDVLFGKSRVCELEDRVRRGMSVAAMLNGGRDVQAPLMFFDLETTGLSGGAGTVAFLVGCGWFESGAFRTRQYLLVDREQPMLQALAHDWSTLGTLVSFNGKSFDAPLLEMRYLFHRLEWIGEGRPHLDVLHPSRRFWRGDNQGNDGDCSLASLERNVLGVRRVGDVAGFEIPERYFRFLRTGDAKPLRAVLDHNREDLLSLAGLTALLLHLASEGPEAARDAREALALGRFFARAGFEAKACDAFGRALSMPQSPLGIRVEALRGLAETRRRARDHHQAAACWQELLELSECPGRVAHEAARALAIHHEHRLGDFQTARAFALQSLTGAMRPSQAEAVQHRLARLERKMKTRGSERETSLRLQL
jgi:uncharacterized protein YprB with RNaseH-like and TPR domain